MYSTVRRFSLAYRVVPGLKGLRKKLLTCVEQRCDLQELEQLELCDTIKGIENVSRRTSWA